MAYYNRDELQYILDRLKPMADDNPVLCGIMGGEVSLFTITPVCKKIEDLLEQIDQEQSATWIQDAEANFFIETLDSISEAQREVSCRVLSKNFWAAAEDTPEQKNYMHTRMQFAVETIVSGLQDAHASITRSIVQPYISRLQSVDAHLEPIS